MSDGLRVWRCPGCDYRYDESRGAPHEGYPPGTVWASVPNDFFCPSCAVRDKQDFVPAQPGGAQGAT